MDARAVTRGAVNRRPVKEHVRPVGSRSQSHPTQARYQGPASTPAQIDKSIAAKAKRQEGAQLASSEQDELAGGKQYVARAESSCEFVCARGQDTTSAEKRFMKQPQRLGDDVEVAFS